LSARDWTTNGPRSDAGENITGAQVVRRGSLPTRGRHRTVLREPRVAVEQFLELLGFGRLHEVVVEAGLRGAPAVRLLSVAREGHQDRFRRRGGGAQPPGDFVAVHAVGQSQVQDDDIRSAEKGHVESGGAVARDEGLVAPEGE
jgi:hypothetical protein